MIDTKEEKGIICPLFTAAFAEQEDCIDKCALVLHIDGKRKCSIRIIAESLYKIKEYING